MIKNLLKYCLCFLLLCFSIKVNAQGLDNKWVLGDGFTHIGDSSQSFLIDFSNGISFDTVGNWKFNTGISSTCISNSNGELLFYTNSFHIGNSTGDTLLNGTCINIGANNQGCTNSFLNTHPQTSIIIPNLSDSNLYYLFYNPFNMIIQQNPLPILTPAFNVYYSIIDMRLDSGRGGVVLKDFILLSDTIGAGKLTATKHGNGKDWWLVIQDFQSDHYIKYLITANGIIGPNYQSIGVIKDRFHHHRHKQIFSPDGSKFANTLIEVFDSTTNDIELLDFDRCTGMFSNPRIINVVDSVQFTSGLSFSPNSKYLYVVCEKKIFQFDTDITNVSSSIQVIGQYDYSNPGNPWGGNHFNTSQLAPDGKIYIGDGMSTSLSFINEPDKPGLLCNFKQRELPLPGWCRGLPTLPNYHLGALTGSLCDTLFTGINSTASNFHQEIKVSPNPSTSVFKLSFFKAEQELHLKVLNAQGKLLNENSIAKGSTEYSLDLSSYSNGLYVCVLYSANKSVSVTLLKQ